MRPRRLRARESVRRGRGDGVIMRERPRATVSFHAGRGTAPKVPARLRQEADRHAPRPPLLDGAGPEVPAPGAERLADGRIVADVSRESVTLLGG